MIGQKRSRAISVADKRGRTRIVIARCIGMEYCLLCVFYEIILNLFVRSWLDGIGVLPCLGSTGLHTKRRVVGLKSFCNNATTKSGWSPHDHVRTIVSVNNAPWSVSPLYLFRLPLR